MKSLKNDRHRWRFAWRSGLINTGLVLLGYLLGCLLSGLLGAIWGQGLVVATLDHWRDLTLTQGGAISSYRQLWWRLNGRGILITVAATTLLLTGLLTHAKSDRAN
ncbi:hypothetical protein ACFQHW_02545 [Lapidilactobacillus achengensis]|uniref:Uncharacterized protein n=1 Tax=Lapidilactobacillus achengensis TaxID=2486000 RepID=A0ABW1UN03_9LACO|nr:hypothetical protein [Lapidilactobacillus achengensis]